MITQVGKRMWNKSSKDRKAVMNNMRRLANLVVAFQDAHHPPNKSLGGDDLLDRQRFTELEEALQVMAEKEGGGIKAGLKLGLGFLLKKSARVMRALYIVNNELQKSKEVDRFLKAIDLSWEYVFGLTQYEVENKRQAVLRKPQSMPLEENIASSKAFTISAMENMIEDPYLKWDSHEFKKMRALIVSRLTLFNARRGGEPSRLTLQEWEDAKRQSWVDLQLLQTVDDPLEKSLLKSFRLTYQRGPIGNQLTTSRSSSYSSAMSAADRTRPGEVYFNQICLCRV
ncbi:uncharacterized protein LOC110985553 [Acanthaster planci]|uniref:Uncharacterized protein LOC110985553 n=1 Tax=Acanthaster planci TaxID=133434 RepID=A0A8B7Z9J8_ACAPL|nr:uncharacterized protein LOC110985553 [Acanthaster planci]